MNARLRILSLTLFSSILLLVGVWAILFFDQPTIALGQAGTGVLRVATTGTDAIGCGSVATPCRTVQYAVDQAANGDEIRVATGVYADTRTRIIGTFSVTQTVFISKSITLRGGYAADFVTYAPQTYPTTLDAQNKGRAVLIYSGGFSVTLEGLRLVNGRGGNDVIMQGGGGVGVTNGKTYLTIRQTDIVSNTAPAGGDDGGGIGFSASPSSSLVLENSRILNNTANSSGGGIWANKVVVTMTNNLVQGNVVNSWGGGVYLYECTAFMTDNTFQSNTSNNLGGGLEIHSGDLVLTRNSILSNTADGQGGGLYAAVDAGHTFSITNNLIQGNVASLNNQGYAGGASLSGASGAQLIFSNNRVLNNVASKGAQPSAAGGLYIRGPASVTDNLFQGNWANDSNGQGAGNGGGLYVVGPALVERNRILDNRASTTGDWGIYYTAYGAGAYVASGVVTMTNNIIAKNLCCVNCWQELYYTDGDAIYVGGQTSPAETQLYLYHNTIADNGWAAIRDDSAALILNHNILSGHARDIRSKARVGGYAAPTVTADYTLWNPTMHVDIMAGTFNHTNDFTGNPVFVSTSLDNYHLGLTSPAIDKGPGIGVTTDIDRNPRPMGAAYDLGADEYSDVNLATSTKSANPLDANVGETVTFTIVLRNTGISNAPNSALSDAIPAQTTYVPHSASASSGTVTDANGIKWTGTVVPNQPVTITFQVTVNQKAFITNTAIVTDTYGTTTMLQAWVNAQRIHLPLITR